MEKMKGKKGEEGGKKIAPSLSFPFFSFLFFSRRRAGPTRCSSYSSIRRRAPLLCRCCLLSARRGTKHLVFG